MAIARKTRRFGSHACGETPRAVQHSPAAAAQITTLDGGPTDQASAGPMAGFMRQPRSHRHGNLDSLAAASGRLEMTRRWALPG